MNSTGSSPPSSKTSLVDLVEDDLQELAGFVAAQSGRDATETLRHLAWLLLENPASRRIPSLGCGLRTSDGTLVGCILYLPQMFVHNQSLTLLIGSSCFYVDESHRGSGGRLFLKFARASGQFPLFGNSANMVASLLWKARGARPIPNSDYELLGIMQWPPIVEEFAHRRGAGKFVSHLAASTTPWLNHARKLKLYVDDTYDLRRLPSVEDVLKLPLEACPSGLTACRDEPYLRWRYFSQDPTIKLFAFCNRTTRREIFVAVNERPRGYRSQIRSVNLLDVFPKVEADVLVTIIAALHERYRGVTDMIIVRGQDAASQGALVQAGFRRRDFESPNGWLLDPRNLLPLKNSYFVPADGDWII